MKKSMSIEVRDDRIGMFRLWTTQSDMELDALSIFWVYIVMTGDINHQQQRRHTNHHQPGSKTPLS